jgi:polygalacturonase
MRHALEAVVLAIALSGVAACGAGCGSTGASARDAGAVSSGAPQGSGAASDATPAGGAAGDATAAGGAAGDATAAGGDGSTTRGAAGGGGDSGSAATSPGCGRDDPALAGLEPSMPSAVCQTLTGAASSSGIQAALDACAGHGAVKLTGGASFTAPSLTLAAGEVLWIDTGAVLNLTGSATPGLIDVTGAGAGVYGEGTIDAKGAAAGTTMIHSSGDGFVLYKVHLINSQKMHVKVQGKGFVVWGNTILAAPTSANTDGIDPGAGDNGVESTGGYIVCNTISVGDDQIAIKGAQGHLTNLTVAHNSFGAGHGMSIGSETGPGGIDGVNVYDLTIDGDVYPGASAVNANGIRIKSYSGAGGVVDHVSYRDICARNLHSAILITPNYTAGTVTSGGTPEFGSVAISDYHLLRGSGTQTPVIAITGTAGTPRTSVTLENVVVDGLTTPIAATSATVTVGPGGASPGVQGATDGTPHAIDCSARFVAIPAQ